MNKFDKQFVVERVVLEFIKYNKKPIPVNSVTYTIVNDVSKVESVIIVILNPSIIGGIIGFGVYFGERNKLIIYDYDGNIISVQNDIEFKSSGKRGKKH